MNKQVFQFEVLIPDEPIKIQDGCQKIQNGHQGAQIQQYFNLKQPKIWV